MEAVIWIVFPLLFAIACFWVRFRPKLNYSLLIVGGMGVLLIGSVFGRDFFAIESGPIPITLDRGLLVGLLVLFAISFFGGKENVRPLNRVDVAIVVWAVVISISTITHDFYYLGNMPASRLLFFNLMPIALYFIVRNARVTKAELKLIAIVFGCFGVYLALTAIAEVNELASLVFPRYIISSPEQEFLGRGRGPFLNPVSNGIFQITCFCCLLMIWPKANPFQRLAISVALLVIVVGVYFTLTRSVWLGLVIACGFFVWLPASRQRKGGMLIAAMIISIIAFPFISHKIFSFKRDKNVTQAEMEISAQMRPMFAYVALNMFKDRPLLGVGFGQYGQTKYPYLQDPHSGKPLTITKSLMQHNVFLAYLTETGLVGLLSLVTMLFLMVIVCWDVWSTKSLDPWARHFGLLGCVILANYCVSGMFHDVSIIPGQHMLALFIVGLVNNIHSDQHAYATASELRARLGESEPRSQVSPRLGGATSKIPYRMPEY